MVFQAKVQSNPENTVGLMTMGGEDPEVLATLSSDMGKILSGTHETTIHGQTHLANSIQVAGLVLKHRQNKAQRQRVVVFVASPVTEDEKQLTKLAKKMKKNNVAIDFVNFGQDEENTSKLQSFIDTVNSQDNSHLVTVPSGPHLLSDAVASSAIIHGNDAPAEGAGPSGGPSGGDFGGMNIDASEDPELALALKLSLEDERARQEREKKSDGKDEESGDKMDTKE